MNQPQSSRLSEIAHFLRTRRTTGAVAPSGKALARKMASHVDPRSPHPVLELGPGTGVVTKALIERGVPPEKIIAIEFNPDFCRTLRQRYPHTEIIEGDAYDLKSTLAGTHAGPFSAVVSSLPLLLRQPEQRRALVRDALTRLAPGGAYVQFSYAPKPPVPASPRDYRLNAAGFVFNNLPPARVWTYRPL